MLAASTLGLITRTTRAAMLEALSQDYIRVARAKGLVRRVIMLGHALPNALLPVVTLGGLAYAQLLTGTVLTENDLLLAGAGPLHVPERGASWTFPAIMGITLVVADRLCGVNLLVDVSYAAAGSARDAPMSGAEAALLAGGGGQRQRRRRRSRWLRRYGLAALGGVVIVAVGARGGARAMDTPLPARRGAMLPAACCRRPRRIGWAPMCWAATCSAASSTARAPR